MPTRGCNCFVLGSEVGSFGYYCPVVDPFFSIGGTSTERRCSSRFPTGLSNCVFYSPNGRGACNKRKSEREKPSIDLKDVSRKNKSHGLTSRRDSPQEGSGVNIEM